MPNRLPPLAIVLGAAGLLPFLAFGLFSIGANPTRAVGAVAGLIGYGAVTLSFLGAVHWGFTLNTEHDPATRARLTLGVVPALIGWSAILVNDVAQSILALPVLIFGFILVVVLESRAHRRGLMPGGYMGLRWVLSVLVVAVLTTVLVLRVVGAHVLF